MSAPAPAEPSLAVWARRLAEGRYVVDSCVIADALIREAVEHARSLPPPGSGQRGVGPALH